MSGLYDHEMHRLLRCLGVDKGDSAWVARGDGGTSAAVFGTEIEALRYAIGRHHEVVQVPYGEDIFTYREPA